jgi:hypothetical protein
MTASKLAGGAAFTLLTDGDVNVLQYLRKNVATNCDDSSRVMCQQLVWGDQQHVEKALQHSGASGFDIVLGSDIIYVEDILKPLWETVAAVVCRDGAFWLSFCRRNVPFGLVVETADQFGFGPCQLTGAVQPARDQDGVYVFCRHAACQTAAATTT